MFRNSLPTFPLLIVLFCSFCVTHSGAYCPNSLTGGCLLEIAEINQASCTSQDIYLSGVRACSASNVDCSGATTMYCTEGDTVNFNFLFDLTTKGATLNDVGVFVETTGKTTAKTGNCCRFVMDPWYINENHSNLDSDNCGDAVPYTTYYQEVSVPVLCKASTDPGNTDKLAFSYCTAWSQTDYDCTGPMRLQPGNGARCFCANATVPNVVVRKPIITWKQGPVGYTDATQTPIYIPFTVNNKASVEATITLIATPIGIPILCCEGTNCQPVTYMPHLVAPGAIFHCFLAFQGNMDPSTEFYITASSTIGAVTTDPETSTAYTIKRFGLTIPSFTLDFTPSASNPAAGTLAYTVTFKNTGSLHTVQTTSPVLFSDCPASFELDFGATKTCHGTESLNAPATGSPVPFLCTETRTVSASLSFSPVECPVSTTKSVKAALTNRVCRPKNCECDLAEMCTSVVDAVCPDDIFDATNSTHSFLHRVRDQFALLMRAVGLFW